MDAALQKTLELILIIAIGYFLQRKLPNKSSLLGIKTIILSIALPATIFTALLKINLDSSLLMLPLLALIFNLLMFGAAYYLLPYFIKADNDKIHRTQSLLIPSLAPGLSCFPFIMAYLGDDQLAVAALADVGNKFFGLILLFIVATYWYRKRAVVKKVTSGLNKLKDLFVSLGSEPINVVIVLALGLLIAGFSLADLPLFAQNIVAKLSLIMVPMILLFIGLSVRIGFNDFIKMLQLLTWRSGMAFLFTGLVLMAIPDIAAPMAMILLVFPQSSCSFWPFAHMCTVDSMEEKDGQTNNTFDQDAAINILACSLPFSTMIIISIFYIGDSLINPVYPLTAGVVFILTSLIPKVVTLVTNNFFKSKANRTFANSSSRVSQLQEK